MPTIKIDHIVSFSSEDSVHVAHNILSTDSNKKWKCQLPGEKQAIVVLQLEKASQITAIDIGNEHSAYVEVHVSRSSNNDDFKVLLANSSFMSALEARQSQNVNKVRMFTKDQLSKPECNEKWDRVKIICSQPFNRHVQFGLSFITLHSNETKEESCKLNNFGKFLIRPQSPDNLSIGSLFAKRKELKLEEKKTTAAAAIRDATSTAHLALYGSPTCKPKLINKDPILTPNKNPAKNSTDCTPKDRNRKELFYTEDDEENNDNIMKKGELRDKDDELDGRKRKNIWGLDIDDDSKTKKIKKNSDEKNGKKEKVANKQDVDKKNTTKTSIKKNVGSPTIQKGIKSNDDRQNIKLKKPKPMKPFHELLQGIVIVISGIQNPDRANIRTMALSMGAKYKPDWDGSCTHLICAFPNTPKFNQVKGKGKIVKKSWIETCYKERKKLPWRRFAMDKNDLDKNESEDEIFELIDLPLNSIKRYQNEGSDDNENAEGSDTEERIAKILAKKKDDTPIKKVVMQTAEKQIDNNEEYLKDLKDMKLKTLSTNERKQRNKHKKIVTKISDTEEEDSNTDLSDIESLDVSYSQSDRRLASPKVLSDSKSEIYEADTDVELEVPNTFQNRRLLDIFRGEKFYVDKTFDENTYNVLRKYILAYNGKCVDDVEDDIDIIITNEANSENMKQANQKAKCIDQKWILKTHRKHKLIPMNNFVF
ncbi:DNA repair protein XRCC1 [Diorhabda carinulata]|uniref:DNA repair protein XRCC1 n=1 Tax=Diorhabda carinulata TaxID=1163345 RepID=UPI0025A00C69|nr:DNA repair protein XRCC1 [Diorhabda carinulata]